MSKSEFNRLGERLIAHQSLSEADLADLETALAAYQQVLGQVKVHLRSLGFAPTDRVKTTTTMTDKLRRTHGMQLSRMQDLAGVRITVHNLAAQDEARDRISEFYTTEGSRWRVIDRREDPRFGYRALHLVVFVDDLPVEIQIRTELQDTWAQIVERLADRWGRGIRYGEDPEHPDSIVRSGKVVVTRRQHLATLTALSDAIWLVEQSRRRSDELKSLLVNADSIWQVVQSAWSESPADKILPRAIPLVEEFAADLAPVSGELDDEVRELMATPPADLTTAQARRVVDAGLDDLRRRDIELTALLASEEQGLRATLQLVAGATDEGV